MRAAAAARLALSAAAAALAGLACYRLSRRAASLRRRIASHCLRRLPRERVPEALRVEHYVDLDAAAARGYAHVAYLRAAHDVESAIDGIHTMAIDFCRRRADAAARELTLGRANAAAEAASAGVPLAGAALVVGEVRCVMPGGGPETFAPERLFGCDEPGACSLTVGEGARVEGGTFDVRGGPIWLGGRVLVEPGAVVRGPAVVGEATVVRRGAYLRGDVVLGGGCVVGCEMKNAITLDGVDCPHHGYVGDSLLGHRAHLGAGATTANFPLLGETRLGVELDGGGERLRYELSRRKMGAVLGDGAQLGCGCVTDPCTLLGAQTHAYPLCYLPRGVYGPHQLLKNRMAARVLERAQLVLR